MFDLQQAELTENLEKKVKEKQDKELLVKAIQSICHNTHFFDRESFLGTQKNDDHHGQLVIDNQDSKQQTPSELSTGQIEVLEIYINESEQIVWVRRISVVQSDLPSKISLKINELVKKKSGSPECKEMKPVLVFTSEKNECFQYPALFEIRKEEASEYLNKEHLGAEDTDSGEENTSNLEIFVGGLPSDAS